jgi:hypothetical protein
MKRWKHTFRIFSSWWVQIFPRFLCLANLKRKGNFNNYQPISAKKLHVDKLFSTSR